MSGCPDFTKPWSPGSEDECAAFLNNIVLKVYSALPSMATASLRWWTTANSVRSVEDGGGRRRPDLVLMGASSDNPTNPKALPPANWRSVHALAELKDREKNSVPLHEQIFQLMGRALFLRAAQDRQLHISGFALCGASFTLFYIDQGGSIVTSEIDVHQQPLLFLHVVLCFAHSTDICMGYDAMASPTHIKTSVLGKLKVHCILFIMDSIHGRGTVVRCAQVPAFADFDSPQFSALLGVNIIVKDTWHDVR
ncbi:hypothetical protein SERLA73DRAFT_73126 [Serpula lacrymans var. lacrymans S7.3]|uniref:Fungal-type protein kinase domain-containing protein n=2 Tax=Serpula lacrymans var. lacrymans TaxID=341189 RepID=F8PU93_SERL3|nr:uncharacterized protein SERLADRAFT_437689 [Serpula lacrymans var. lacrymans S7.9]EGO00406.1 hypothetical protein SERLA73DRAFT_73126 [Serpula lacrymans var. lacrymans S7.3]EGO25963.1 hypothetical protein SERLADRAFT_437689 [Serpula lacrymans var. lacrymans S7.9]